MPDGVAATAAESPGAEGWIPMARLGKPRGLHGEMFAVVLCAHPEWMQSLDSLYLFRPGVRDPAPVSVERLWEYSGKWVIRLRGVESVTAAEALRGAEIRLPREKRPPAPDGEIYYEDLVGCEVIGRDGRRIGVVEDWQDPGGPPLLVVKEAAGHEFLMPFVPAICVAVDLKNRRVTVELPEGLIELTREN